MLHPRIAAPFFIISLKLLFLFSLLLLLSTPGAFGQTAGSPAVPGDDFEPQSLFEIIQNGGTMAIIVWLAILLTSMIMVGFVIQLLMTLRREHLAPRALVDALRNEITAGNYQGAWETCNANDNYLANVLQSGLERIGRGKEAVEDAIAEHALRETLVLRTRNSYLSVIGVVSPMLGLLGTVIGMLGAFQHFGQRGISDPRGLATSISEVLMATAAGLFIAIPAFIAYYIFRSRIQMAVVYADDQINDLLLDLPYEDLAGLRIGANFDASASLAESGAKQARRVSMELTTNCPVCNGAVTPNVSPCPHCGSTLEWAG